MTAQEFHIQGYHSTPFTNEPASNFLADFETFSHAFIEQQISISLKEPALECSLHLSSLLDKFHRFDVHIF
jgi:hypothetical protein